MSQSLFNGIGKRRLIIAVTVWSLMLVLGGICLWWGFFGADREEATPEPHTAPTQAVDQQPQPTQTGGEQPQPTAVPTQEVVSPPAEEEVFGYGIAADGLLLPEYTMTQIKGLGLGWVKQQVRWADFSTAQGQMDWSGYDAVVEAANREGLKVMLSVVNAPAWSRSYFDSNPEAAPPDDLNLYAEFLAELVDRYQGRIHAIEVWNEQNLDREWDTAEGVSPERYVEMLQLAYQVIKSRDPNIIVISGALSPTGGLWTDPNNANRITVMDDFDYLDQAITAGLLEYCDCVGAHHNGINIPPTVDCDGTYQDPNATFHGYWDTPHHSWCFKTTLEGYHQRIALAGSNTPLCVTEFGWASSEGLGGYPPGFEFAQDNTLQEQADWDVQAFQQMRDWGFVRLAFLWNLDYANKGPRTPDDPNAPYSLVDYDGVARPAFGAIGAMEKP